MTLGEKDDSCIVSIPAHTVLLSLIKRFILTTTATI